jgi:hypothetical protein
VVFVRREAYEKAESGILYEHIRAQKKTAP